MIIGIGLLLSMISMNIMAATSEQAFTEHTVRQESGLYTVYQVKLDYKHTLAFFMNHKDTSTTARLLTNNGKSYLVLSAYYCQSETDNC